MSAIVLLVLTLPVIVHPAGAQTDKAAAVVRDMIEALGGKSFLEVREIRASGKYFTFRGDRSSGSQVFVDYIKFPDKDRQELGTAAIKPTIIHNGDSGWSVNDKKIEPLPAAEVKEFQTVSRSGFQYLSRFVLNRPGLMMLHAGTEMVDFKRNDVIEVRDSGNLFRLFVDQQSHLPTKMEVRRSGEAVMREEQFANWHVFQGLPTPLYIIHFEGGEKTMEVRYDNVSYNSGLADSLFAPPAAR